MVLSRWPRFWPAPCRCSVRVLRTRHKKHQNGQDLFPEQRVVEHVVLGSAEVALEDDRVSGVQHVDLAVRDHLHFFAAAAACTNTSPIMRRFVYLL